MLAQYSLFSGTARWPSTEPTLTTIGRLPARRRQGLADELGGGEEIDFHDLPQAGLVGLVEAAEAADAGVVDQGVEAAEFAGSQFEGGGAVLAAA